MSTTTTTTSTRTTLKAESPSSSSPSSTAKPTADRPNTDSTKKQGEEELDIYDEIEIEDMTYDSTLQIYHYPCPCGDRFEINVDSLRDGEDIAVCPSCSLMIRVIFDVGDLPWEGGGGLSCGGGGVEE